MNIKRFANDPLQFFDALVIPSANGDRRFSEVMADYQRKWFQDIAPSLLDVANGKRPPIGKFWCERTKGGSKDSDAACCLLWLLAFTRRPLDGQVGAADRDQANELKKAASDILRLNGWLNERVQVQSWSVICKATKSECTILATDVASSHGARPDFLIINELSHIRQEEFASNLADNATKKPNGLQIVATNSGFANTWQERWRNLARDSDNWHYHAMAEPAPWLSETEIEEAERRNSKARFARLFWGQWVSQLGDALDSADITACVSDTIPQRTKHSFYIGGLDLGIRHDHSALIVIQGDRQTQQLALAYARSWSPDLRTGKIDLMQVEEAVAEAHKQYNLSACGFDPYQAELMAQRLSQRTVPMREMQFTGANLNLMANTLLDVFRSRRITLFRHPALLADLNHLQLEEKSYGYRLSATRDETGHADLATALAIALPLAVDLVGKRAIVAGALVDEFQNAGFYERWLEHTRRREAEMKNAFGSGGDPLEAREAAEAAMRDLHQTDPFFTQWR